MAAAHSRHRAGGRLQSPCGGGCQAVWAVLATLPMIMPVVATEPPRPRPGESGRKSTGEFAPGVRIDWQARAVYVDARVVLRAGALELLACSPQTREHESVLVVLARPMHIHQALGLIGLEPGHPVRYDRDADTITPPTGSEVTLRVRFGDRTDGRTIPARELMRLTGTDKPPSTLRWVFAGSRTFESGRYGADVEGTVACVVDFDTALIALDTLHTADNQQLWLEANTTAIPPIGTPATLIITAAGKKDRLVATLERDAQLRIEGQPVSAEELAERITTHAGGPPLRLIIQVDAAVTAGTVAAMVAAIRTHGVAADQIVVRRESATGQDGASGSEGG